MFRGSFKKLKSFGGLYAKYLHYLYLMGKLPKRNQRKPLSPEMREAWRHLDRYSRQVTLVSNKKLHTLDDVKAFITDTDKEIKEVTELREKVYNKLRYCDDDDRIRELKRAVTIAQRSCGSSARKRKSPSQSLRTSRRLTKISAVKYKRKTSQEEGNQKNERRCMRDENSN